MYIYICIFPTEEITGAQVFNSAPKFLHNVARHHQPQILYYQKKILSQEEHFQTG